MEPSFDLPITELRRALQSGPRLRLAMLFGSSTNGRLHGRSDVDIAIIPEDSTLSLREELRLQAELTRIAAREVDLVRLDHAPTLLRYEVAKHGISLYEAGPFEASRFIAAAVGEFLDFEPSLRRAAELFRRRVAGDKPARGTTEPAVGGG